MNKQKGFFLAIGMMVAPFHASALSYSVFDQHSLSSTNWTDVLSVAQFDTLSGTRILDSVDIAMDVTIEGFARAESMDSSPVVATIDWGSNVTLDLSTIGATDLYAEASITFVESLTSFDGSIDWGGTSGVTRDNLLESDSDSYSTMSASELAYFTGLGTVGFSAASNGASTASGSGNLFAWLSTSASAVLEVTYNYHETTIPMPNPASTLLLGIGLVGLGAMKRSSRHK